MKTLAIDLETYSSVKIAECGLHKYVESADFEILLFAFSADGAPAVVVDLAGGEEVPADVLAALTDAGVKKTAYNAHFELACLSKVYGPQRPEQWFCTMAAGALRGYPLGLGLCAEALGAEVQKMKEGKALISYFCTPAPRTGKRRRKEDAPEKWELFKAYCRADVDTETAVRAKLGRFYISEFERAVWLLDYEINLRGVQIDLPFVEKCARLDEENRAALLDELRELTGLDNPNSLPQLKGWLQSRGVKVETLRKDDTAALLKYAAPAVRRALEIRQETGKTSVKKYAAMLACVMQDGRVRGLTQYYGAARTGRWAGRLIQLQNLPQNHLKDIHEARALVMGGTLEEIKAKYPNVSQLLSELVRTAFIGKPGTRFVVCDFSAIEARVIAWLAGEEWVLDTFRNGGDIYCATASKMYGVPVEKHGQNAELRQKGKIATLALGYGGGVAALEAMGGAAMGLSVAEMERIKMQWRAANTNIVAMWAEFERLARLAIKHATNSALGFTGYGVGFRSKHGALCVALPSGRELYYPGAWIDGRGRIFFDAMNQTTRKWGQADTYGGKLTENIVQAVARDCLAHAMLMLKNSGFDIVFHVHDEVVVECGQKYADNPAAELEYINAVFATPPQWAKGLPLKGAGYITPYYLKD